MIVILNVGTGNILSLKNCLDFLDIKNIISNEKKDFNNASKIILPGVGSFDHFIDQVESYNILDDLKEQILIKKKLFLGICAGMQVLFDSSEEGNKKGLGFIQGKLKKFNNKEVRTPHMGLNFINIKKKSVLIDGLDYKSRFYFVHSYYVSNIDYEHVIATTNNTINFPSIVGKENIFGVQFHPEKSQSFGKKLLSNFGAL